MTDVDGFQYLEFRPRSSVRQPFVKGRGVWAETLYDHTRGEDAQSPQRVAEDFGVPLGAVLESIAYCEQNQDFLQAERERRIERSKEYFRKHPPVMPPGYVPEE